MNLNINIEENTLKEIYDISSKLYTEMCSDKEKDHAAIFEYMIELASGNGTDTRRNFGLHQQQV